MYLLGTENISAFRKISVQGYKDKRKCMIQVFKRIHTAHTQMPLAPPPPPHTHPKTPQLHHSIQYDILSIFHLSSEVRQRGCCLLPSASVLSHLLRSNGSFRENRGEKVLRVGVLDWWIGCYYGGAPIPTFSALFMDDKAQVINKRRTLRSLCLILLMWCWLMEAGEWPV